MGETKSKGYQYYCNIKLHDKAAEKAKAQGISLSYVLSLGLERYVEEVEGGTVD